MSAALQEMIVRLDPASILEASGLIPDPWQARALRSSARRSLWCCARQSGKSTAAAAVALREALFTDGSLVLLVSSTQRQAQELFNDKLLFLWRALGRPRYLFDPTLQALHLSNGSRVLALPAAEHTIRGYSSVRLAILDEGARVPDPVFHSLTPMLAVSGGRLLALSTPCGRRGWFYSCWTGPGTWERVAINASDCGRISAEFLAEERARMGERLYQQEYFASFESDEGALFTEELITRCVTDTVTPL